MAIAVLAPTVRGLEASMYKSNVCSLNKVSGRLLCNDNERYWLSSSILNSPECSEIKKT